MTQVWMCRNSDTDIHLFNRQDHLRPSVEISFSRCTDVTITERYVGHLNELIFEVKGKIEGLPFTEQVVFRRLPVWTEPSHL